MAESRIVLTQKEYDLVLHYVQKYADDNALLSSKQDIKVFNKWVEHNL